MTTLRDDVAAFLAQLDQVETALAFAPTLPGACDLDQAVAAVHEARAAAETLDVTDEPAAQAQLAALRAAVERTLGANLDDATWTNEP